MPGTPGPFLGAGATFSFTPSGGSLTGITLLTNINIPGFEFDDINVSTLGVVPDANGVLWKAFLRGWADGQEVEFEGIFDPTVYSLLMGFRGKAGVGLVTFSNGSGFSFPGYIK